MIDFDNFTLDASGITGTDLDVLEEEPEPEEPVAGETFRMIPVSSTGSDISRMLFLDIETIPDETRLHLHQAEQPQDVPVLDADPESVLSGKVSDFEEFLKKNDAGLTLEYLDKLKECELGKERPRATITGLVNKVKGERLRSAAKAQKELSVNPFFCRVAAYGWAIGTAEPESLLCHDLVQERAMLVKFWEMAEAYSPICGYWHTAFDLPVLFVRSMILGVKPSRLINLSPYGKDCLDLCVKLFGTKKSMGLKQVAKLLGIDVPAGDFDGSMVAETFATDPEKVAFYVRSDVLITQQVRSSASGYFVF